MHRPQTLILVFLLAPMAQAQFSGKKAYDHTAALVEIGPRPPGSAGIRKAQQYIVGELKAQGWQVTEDGFTARTPIGNVAMKNIVAFRQGSSGRAVALSGHYDTKIFPFRFVGANDGGSSAGFLLEMARALRNVPLKNSVYLVFFDGEEAVREWTPEDSLYGSRHLAARWYKDGTLAKLAALINVDMIGDRDLRILREQYSSDVLMRLIGSVARQQGVHQHFDGPAVAIEDDHVPFLRLGARAANLIDFEYGPENSWWHTPQDTMDKLSPRSFEIVGNVLIEVLRRLDAQ
ncbi:MAG: M28 family peptidase [Bryobacteraceae bacterium]|nr:M28 family peptidase [Bryobacteraceae bacterium]MCX7603373.1 M28 family peptidase [Bryobacteraceae bacterium]